MRKLYYLVFIAVFLSLFPMPAFASVTVVVDGKPLSQEDQPAFVSGKLMVPMRAIFEKLGANVVWDNGLVTASLGTTEIKFQINSLHGKVNNRPTFLPAPPLMINNKTMVPVRFVSETLGADVDYLQHSQLVLITSPLFKITDAGADFAFKRTLERYAKYRNETIVNESSFDNYNKVKGTLLEDVDCLNKHLEMLTNEKSDAVIHASTNAANAQSLRIAVKDINPILEKYPLTRKLGNYLDDYAQSLLYAINDIAKNQNVTESADNMLQKACTEKQAVVVQINLIDQEMRDLVVKAHQGF